MKNEQKWLLQEMYNEGYRDIKIEGIYAFFVNPTFIENGGNFKIRDHTPRIPCKVLGLNPNIRKYSIASLLGFVEWERVPVDTPIIIETETRELKRYFAKYDGMNVWFYGLGGTSWSANSIKPCGDWKVRLAENGRD